MPGANAVAAEMGQRLGYLLLTLKRGDPANRAARPDWDDRNWSFWAKMERIVFGGGLVSGHLGRKMLFEAQRIVGNGYTLEIAPHAVVLPLLGLARHALPGSDTALVFDFGQTAVKRARAYFTGNTCTALDVFSAIPSPKPQRAQELLASIVDIITRTWNEAYCAGRGPSARIMACMASYVIDGQPADDPLYGMLRTLSNDASHLIAEAMTDSLHAPVSLLLLHDGTSAAIPYTGAEHIAVITIGTAMRVGFPPPISGSGDGLRLLARDIQMRMV